jgi:hypothetical protein
MRRPDLVAQVAIAEQREALAQVDEQAALARPVMSG